MSRWLLLIVISLACASFVIGCGQKEGGESEEAAEKGESADEVDAVSKGEPTEESKEGEPAEEGQVLEGAEAGGASEDGAEPSEPKEPSAQMKIVKLVAGNELSCGLRADGKLLCWGINEHFVLGHKDLAASAVRPVVVPGLDEIEDFWLGESESMVTAGSIYGTHSYNTLCARKKGGEVWCWGFDKGWVLHGGEQPEGKVVALKVDAFEGAVDIAFGGGTSCAVLASGEVQCWGDNAFKALGREVSEEDKMGWNDYRPGAVDGVADAEAIAVGLNLACVRTKAQELWCWGNDKAPYKVEEEGLAGKIKTLAMDNGDDALFLIEEGGKVSRVNYGYRPMEEVGVLSALDATYTTGCGLDEAGELKCWCSQKQWSFMDCEEDYEPVQLSLAEPATQVALGDSHGCALLQSGRVQCWGENRRGQLGDGSLDDRPAPVFVRGLDTMKSELEAEPAGATLPAAVWPGEGLEACSDLAAPADANFTPRTIKVESARTTEGNWKLNLTLSPDLAEAESIGRPRGEGVVVKVDLMAQEELQKSPDGSEVALGSLPLVAGSYEIDAPMNLQITGMDRTGLMRPKEAVVELSTVDMESGVVCGTLEMSYVRGHLNEERVRQVKGRFGLRIPQSQLDAGKLVEQPAAVQVNPVKVDGGELGAELCAVNGLEMVSHSGESRYTQMKRLGETLAIKTSQKRWAFLAPIEGEACQLEVNSQLGVNGYVLPDDDYDLWGINEAGEMTFVGYFGRVYTASAQGAQSKRCERKDEKALRLDPRGEKMLSLDATPRFKVSSVLDCSDIERWTQAEYSHCSYGAFIDAEHAAAVCDQQLHFFSKDKVIFSVGSNDYADPQRIPASPLYLGPCGEGICLVADNQLLVWRRDGSFFGKTDLLTFSGAKQILGAAADPEGLLLMADYPRTKDGISADTRVLRINGFPGGAAATAMGGQASEPAEDGSQPGGDGQSPEGIDGEGLRPKENPHDESGEPMLESEEPEVELRDAAEVKAFCAKVKVSVQKFSAKGCKPLGKRLERQARQPKFGLGGLMSDPALKDSVGDCAAAAKAAEECMGDPEVEAFFGGIQ